MPSGGKREGAGRKPGAATKMNEAARKAAADGGIMPLEYMLTVLRDTTLTQADRMDAAKAAAPYVHAKLAAVEHSGKLETDNTHHVEETVRPFAEFLAGAIGPGAGDVSGGTGSN